MHDDVVYSVTRRQLRWSVGILALALAIGWSTRLPAQKAQEDYGDKFRVATEDGGVAIATSSDGRYVYIVGKKGLIVSDDHGRTGSWVQTVRLK